MQPRWSKREYYYNLYFDSDGTVRSDFWIPYQTYGWGYFAKDLAGARKCIEHEQRFEMYKKFTIKSDVPANKPDSTPIPEAELKEMVQGLQEKLPDLLFVMEEHAPAANGA
jgi:hypothetical protein